MSKKNKILLKITGSIAAYKSCYLISKLVQNGYEVQTVVSKDALEFIGKASLEGLTGKQVFIDTFEDGKMMSHINLVKWADLTIIAPATGNTINKMAAGIADNLLLSLFLAHDWQTPYIIAPAMNTNMYNHPATQSSIAKLKSYGVEFIEPAAGMLACGDEGVGKLADPDEIYKFIVNKLNDNPTAVQQNSKTVLITAGGTKENIDGVRYISNMSSGKTASALAETLYRLGYKTTYIHASSAILPNIDCKKITYESFSDLNAALKNELENFDYDLIIHNAAVSDFFVDKIKLNDETFEAPYNGKFSSKAESMEISLKRNFKIVDEIKSYSRNKDVKLVSFKLVNGISEDEKIEKIRKLLSDSNSDYVVLNDLKTRENDIQTSFKIFDVNYELASVETAIELAETIDKLFTK